jgi:hypothetical protein
LTVSVALHGNLRDFGIGDVFQLIGQQRKTGILAVQGRGVEVELRFHEGRIVSAAPVGAHEQAALAEMLVRCGLLTQERLAELERERENSLLPLDRLLAERGVLARQQIDEIEDLLSRDTIFELLRWTEGSFRFVARPIEHERDPQALLGAEQVLMDGLRMVDEWRSIEEEIPSDSAVFRRTGSFDEYRRSRTEADPSRLAEQERVLLLIDGRLPVRRIIDLSRLGTFECMRILVSLRSVGLVQATDPPRVSRRGAKRAAPLRLRGVAASAFAVGALVAVFVLVHARGPSLSPSEGFSIERLPFHAARLRFETRRLRNIAEAFFFDTGRWPENLEELTRWGSQRQGSLTPSVSGYYYAKRQDGIVLLAPEH